MTKLLVYGFQETLHQTEAEEAGCRAKFRLHFPTPERVGDSVLLTVLLPPGHRSLKKKKRFILFHACAHVCRCPGVGVPGGCELLNEGAWNQTRSSARATSNEPSLQHLHQFFPNECMPTLGTFTYKIIFLYHCTNILYSL